MVVVSFDSEYINGILHGYVVVIYIMYLVKFSLSSYLTRKGKADVHDTEMVAAP